MNYPQPPYGQPQSQGYPGQQAPNYAPQPGYPAQPSYTPGTSYTPPPQSYNYPPQGMQPPQEQVRGTLKDFMDQPAGGGGPSLSFPHPGTSYGGIVIRNVTDADVQAQTDLVTGAVGKYSDGRPKLVMKVPLLLQQPNPAYPEGVGVWYVKGNDRAELARAMEAAGAQAGPPQAGDTITVTYTHDQPGRRGMNPTKIKRVEYVKGNGVAPVLPQAQQAGAQYITQPGQPLPPYQQTGQAPAVAYPQATGQPMLQPTQYQDQYGNPVQFPPMAAPAPAPAQPAVPVSPYTPVPGGPPPDWPADVPFIPGLTPAQARVAQSMGHPAASG